MSHMRKVWGDIPKAPAAKKPHPGASYSPPSKPHQQPPAAPPHGQQPHGGHGKSGHGGGDVTWIQQSLKSLGYDPGQIDGIMGPHTKAAIKKFQQANHLAADGIVGPKTHAALEQALGGCPPQPPGGPGGPQQPGAPHAPGQPGSSYPPQSPQAPPAANLPPFNPFDPNAIPQPGQMVPGQNGPIPYEPGMQRVVSGSGMGGPPSIMFVPVNMPPFNPFDPNHPIPEPGQIVQGLSGPIPYEPGMERVELPAGMPGPPAVIFVPAGRKDVVLENFENPPANDDPESPYSEEPYPDADTAADVEASLGYMEKAVEDLPESVERGLGYIADDVEQGAENIADWVTGKDQDKEDEVDDQYNQ